MFFCHIQPMLEPHQHTNSSNNSNAVSSSSVVSGGVVSGGGDSVGGGGTGGGALVGCGRGRGLNLKMKFVCGQCWREGQVNEPDKSLKYCTAKARHRLAFFYKMEYYSCDIHSYKKMYMTVELECAVTEQLFDY